MRTRRVDRSRARLTALLIISGIAWAGSLGGPAHAESSDVWNEIPDQDVFALKTWLNKAGELNVLVGDRLTFHFESAADVHLIAVHVGATGVLTLLAPPGGALRGGVPASFPPAGSPAVPIASEPLGREVLIAVATAEPLPRDVVVRAEAIEQIEGRAAEEFARRLVAELLRRGPATVDVARVHYEVVAADAPRRYTSRGITDHFLASKTRSVRRKKLDLDIQFEFDSVALTPRAQQDLDEVGRALEAPAMRSRRFELSGHTDDVGVESYNQQLSQRRAEAVRAYLLERFALEPDALEARGYGESRPARPGSDPSDRRRNRRVVLEILP